MVRVQPGAIVYYKWRISNIWWFPACRQAGTPPGRNNQAIKMLKRIIAKEVLIISVIGCLLFILSHFFLQNATVILPKYKLDFANGETYVITIMPQIRTYASYSKFLEEAYNPSLALIEKRIKEFKGIVGIKSALKEKKYVNAYQVNLSRLYSRIVGIPFIFKLVFVYLILVFIRLIIWAGRLSMKSSPHLKGLH